VWPSRSGRSYTVVSFTRCGVEARLGADSMVHHHNFHARWGASFSHARARGGLPPGGGINLHREASERLRPSHLVIICHVSYRAAFAFEGPPSHRVPRSAQSGAAFGTVGCRVRQSGAFRPSKLKIAAHGAGSISWGSPSNGKLKRVALEPDRTWSQRGRRARYREGRKGQ